MTSVSSSGRLAPHACLLVGLLVLGGCNNLGHGHASDGGPLFPHQSFASADNYERNHPIRVVSDKHELIVELTGGENAILSDRQRNAVQDFLAEYRNGSGKRLTLFSPSNAVWDRETQARLVASLVDVLSENGLSERDYDLVSSVDPRQAVVYPYPRASLRYQRYRASPPKCRDWNYIPHYSGGPGTRLSPQLGCTLRHNLAAQIADAEDLVAPGALSPRPAELPTSQYERFSRGESTASANGQVSVRPASDAF